MRLWVTFGFFLCISLYEKDILLEVRHNGSRTKLLEFKSQLAVYYLCDLGENYLNSL